jgi:putative peptidoglycan lipid II flippase
VVIPVLIETERADKTLFRQVVGSILGHTLVIAAALAILTAGVAIAIGYTGTTSRALLVGLTGAMAVQVLAGSVRAFFVGLFNARGHFRVHPVASGIGVGLTFAVLALGRGALGVRVIPLAMCIGEIVAIGILASLASTGLGLGRIGPNLSRPEPVRRVLRLVRFETAGQLITRANPLVDQLMAGLCGVVGGGTLLKYANDVASLPTSVVQATFLPIFLTRVSEQAKATELFGATLRRSVLAVVGILGGLSLALALFRLPVCRLVFLHGEMDEAGVATIAEVLPYGLVGVAPFGALLVLARAHVAQQNTRIMPSMGLLNSALNAGLNLALLRVLGLRGLALSTSLTYVVVAIVFWYRLPKALRT